MTSPAHDIPTAFERLLTVIVLAGAIVVITVAWSIEPDPRGLGTHEQLDLDPCGYLLSTGRPCATCGMTTAFSHTVRFQIPSAIRANFAGCLLCLVTMAAPAWLGLALWERRSAFAPLRRRFGWIAVGTAVVVGWSWARNVASGP